MYACEEGNKEIVERLLQMESLNITSKSDSSKGRNAFLTSCVNDFECMKLLANHSGTFSYLF